MSQVLHIFKKDARHLWPEILVSLALTAAFVRVCFGGVSNLNGVGSPFVSLFAQVLAVLVPFSWWVLAARAVHDEALVGENQFWITRPYHWQSLLAAKALFLAAFLYLPIFLAQVVLLRAAGFHPFAYLPGILYNLVLLSGILVLPIAAIATITSSFSRLVLTLLGAVVYLALFIWTLNSGSSPGKFGFPNPYQSKVTFSLFFLVFVLVIVLQYATRYTWRSRWILLGLPPLAAACTLAWPIQTLARHLYPPVAAAEQPPVQLTFDPDPDRQSTVNPHHQKTGIDLYLPLTVSGMASDTAIQNEASQVTFEAPDGQRWSSEWLKVPRYYRPDVSRSFLNIPIDEKYLDRIKTTPVTVTVRFAITQLRADTPIATQTGNGDFDLLGGKCSFFGAMTTYPECRFPLNGPKLAFVTTYWTDGPCLQTQYSSNAVASTWVGAIDRSPAEFGLDPVKVKSLIFPYPSETHHRSFICPDTPITAVPYSAVRRLQTTLVIPNLDLTKYTVDRFEGPTRSSATVRTR